MNGQAQIPRPAGSPPKPVSEPALKRLPLYHRCLQKWEAAGQATVSGTDLGPALALDPTQVRTDLKSVGVAGWPRIGYVPATMTGELEQFLGWNNLHAAFRGGAGRMGSARLGYCNSEPYRLKIVTALEPDPLKTGPQPTPLNPMSATARPVLLNH